MPCVCCQSTPPSASKIYGGRGSWLSCSHWSAYVSYTCVLSAVGTRWRYRCSRDLARFRVSTYSSNSITNTNYQVEPRLCPQVICGDGRVAQAQRANPGRENEAMCETWEAGRQQPATRLKHQKSCLHDGYSLGGRPTRLSRI